MDQEQIAKRIKEIRLKNNMSQQQFADQYGVTYQAVSKWENGKNIPDISILKQICNDYHMDLNQLLDGKNKKNTSRKWIYLGIGAFLFVVISIFLFEIFHNHPSFEFKTLSSSCEDFNIRGSIAYNQNKSSIYISHIDYCGGKDNNLYQKFQCSLYETSGNTSVKINDWAYESEDGITLEDFLRDIQLQINDYDKVCENYSENSLHLEITANDANHHTTIYKIPLQLEESCNSNLSTAS